MLFFINKINKSNIELLRITSLIIEVYVKCIRIGRKLQPCSLANKHFMRVAITLARNALDVGDFPVGCVIECDGKIIADGFRTSSVGKNANEIEHAEINALRKLSFINSNKYDCSRMTLYCTLEPCLMCFGAILLTGIGKIVFAYEDVMGGGTACDLLQLPSLYTNKVESIISGVLRAESLALFKKFFNNPNNAYWMDSKLSFYTKEQDNS